MKTMKVDMPDVRKHGKPITDLEFKKFGITPDNVYTHATNMADLSTQSPNIIIAECVRKCEFMQNKFKVQQMVRKQKYVMSLSVYRQLHHSDRFGGKVLRPAPGKRFNEIYKPYKGQDLSGKRLLIWRTGGIGDLCFIQPNLIYLKEKYPTCEIYFACGPQYHAMVETWDCIDKLVDLPFNWLQLIRADYHMTFEGVIERCEEAKHENAYNLFSRWMGLDLPDEKLMPYLKPKTDQVKYVNEILDDWGLADKPFVLAQLRASSPIRTPRPEVWANILNGLVEKGYNVVITDAKHYEDGVSTFIKQLIKDENKDKVFNFAPHSETLDSTIALASLAKVVVCIDSALVHISAALRVRSVPIYGPFPSKIRVSTYQGYSDPVECNDVPCAPCYIHGHVPCKYNVDEHGICFDKIKYDELFEKVSRVINT